MQELYTSYGVGILILALLIYKAVIIVDEKTFYVIQRLGKFNRMAGAGFGIIIPFIDSKVGILNMRIQQLDVDIETKTQDDVFVHLRVSVQYQVMQDKLWDAYYSLDNPRHQISSYIFDDVRAEVPKMELDDVFAKKDDIADAVRKNLSDSMHEYGYIIVKALITDIDPDANVKESMNKINAAKREKEAAIEEAEAQKIRVVKAAEADAESKRLSGEGIAQQRLEIVRGFKDSVEDFQKTLKNITHEEVMQFVLLTQYFDTLNNIGQNGKNTSILVPHSPSAMKDFQQQIVEGTLIGKKLQEASDDDD
ncbi:MAG: SPFH domain-containing protein [Flavobacteriales bacterium]|jgi:regulator of protease activity HflC (stomatin/prohibitin superfamily)|nr:SPFH domain-containing protein [Flavobacteriales bacterium]